MILATRSGDRHVRSIYDYGYHEVSASAVFHRLSAAGEPVDADAAAGLTAVGRAIRLVSGLVGGLPIGVFQGRKGDRVEQPDSPQAILLESPVLGMSVYDWRYDIAASLEVCENAFLLKRKGRGRVTELVPIPHENVNAHLTRTGEKRFRIGTQEFDAETILHIRGQTIDGGPFGVSRIHQHRDPLGAMLAAQRFEGAYFRNHARPDIAVVFPEHITREKAAQWRDEFQASYGGAGNAGRPIPIGGGADIKPIPFSMADAQFLESKKLSVEEIGRIMDVEPTLLGAAAIEQQDSNVIERFLAFQLWPRLHRITEGLRADPDVFPPTDRRYPLFDLDELMFASPLTKSEVQHRQIQSGILLPDEARADNNRPPLADGVGQVPQITPVGGAPNPNPLPATDDDEPEEEDDDVRRVTIPSIEIRADIPPAEAPDLTPVADAMRDQLAVLTAAEQAREQRRREQDERRAKLDETQAGLVAAQTEALRQLGQITVNVEPTPVQVDVHVPAQDPPVVNVNVDPQPADKTVKFKRDPSGRITAATVTEE